MTNTNNGTSQDYGGKASTPERVSFSVTGGRDALKAAINELHLTSGDVTKIGNTYYVKGLKPGAPINNQNTGE